MGRFRWLLKLFVTVFLSVCALMLLFWLWNQIEQHAFRRRVQILQSEIQFIELRKTTWAEAQTLFQRWGANRQYGPHCDSDQCSLQVTLDNPTYDYISRRNLFVRLDDYFRWKLKLSFDVGPFVRTEFYLLKLLMCMGGHPARLIAKIGMRHGVVWSKGISLQIETYAHPAGWSGNWSSEFGLIADLHSVSRFDYFDGPWIDPQLVAHPDYEIGQPGGCEVCVLGWVKFTPYAAPEDVQRLMQLDLSCLTRWHPCTTQSEIMPAAWAQYTSEHNMARGTERSVCSPVIVEILGRDSAYAAAGELVRFHKIRRGDIAATVRVLNQMKGAGGTAAWHPGELRTVSLLPDTPCAPEKLLIGMRLIFFGGFDRSNNRLMPASSPWPVMPMTATNLPLFHHGIAQDYAAMVQSPITR